MKTLIFIILTIGVICLIPLALLIMYGIGWLILEQTMNYCNQIAPNILVGGVAICVAGMAGLVLYILADNLFPLWFAQNKVWSEKIYNKLKSK